MHPHNLDFGGGEVRGDECIQTVVFLCVCNGYFKLTTVKKWEIKVLIPFSEYQVRRLTKGEDDGKGCKEGH